MGRNAIDLTNLRDAYAGTPRDSTDTRDRGLSRRQLFGVAGTAVVGTSPVLRALAASGPPSWKLVGDSRRLAFVIDDQERWVIDTRQFSGHPRLSVHRDTGYIRLELQGALFPGTAIPADFRCDLRAGLSGWKMLLRLALGGFRGEVNFEHWLQGEAPARSRLQLGHRSVRVCAGVSVLLQGRVQAEYRPDWTLRLAGPSVARLDGVGSGLATDVLTIALPSSQTPSVFQHPAARRLLLSLERGRRDWSLGLATLRQAGQWSLSEAPGTFDRLYVELGERRGGGAQSGLLAIGAGPGLGFRPPEGRVARPDGAFLLSEARYAVTFEPDGTQTAALLARTGANAWYHHQAVSVQVGDGAGMPSFELHARKGRVRSVHFQPSALAATIPIPDAIVLPTALPEGARVSFGTARPVSAAKGHVGHFSLSGKLGPLQVNVPGISLLRPEDLLVLFVAFDNLQVQPAGGGGLQIAAIDPNKPSYLIPTFQTQHLADRAFKIDEGDPPTFPPVDVIGAGASRLAFQITSSQLPLPYTLTAVLDWTKYSLSVNVLAVPPHGTPPNDPNTSRPPDPAQPATTETSLELPYRLILSPPVNPDGSDLTKLTGWAHATDPVTHDSLTELWHTRMAEQTTAGAITEVEHLPPGELTVRAVWSPDYPSGSGTKAGTPFEMSLSPDDRYQIVGLSSTFYQMDQFGTSGPYDPEAIPVERLMLSALGAHLKVNAVWRRRSPYDVEAWKHRMSTGRDDYVRVVHRGYLFPLGNRAVLLEVTERKVYNSQWGEVAYLLKREFIAVREPTKTFTAGDYPSGWSEAFAGRKMPLKTVTITNLMSPSLANKEDVPVTISSAPEPKGTVFWPQVQGSSGSPTDFLFKVNAIDMLGQPVAFDLPMIFVTDSDGVPQSVEAMTEVQTSYLDPSNVGRRERDLHAQTVGFVVPLSTDVPPASVVPDGGQMLPNLKTQTLRFSADVPDGSVTLADAAAPRFFPALGQAEVYIPPVQQLTGQSAPSPIVYEHDHYLVNGLGGTGNPGEVWAVLQDEGGSSSAVPVGFGVSSSNGASPNTPGVARPNMSVQGLSTSHGTVSGDPAQFAGGTFDPSQTFASGDAKILGVVPLSSILAPLIQNPSLDPSQDPFHTSTPRLYQQQAPDAHSTGLHRLDDDSDNHGPPTIGPSGKVYRMDYETKQLQSFGPFQVSTSTVDSEKTDLKIQYKYTEPFDGSAPIILLKGSLTHFTLDLAVIKLTFEKVKFMVDTHSGVKIDPSIDSVAFEGALQFVEQIKQALGNDFGPYGFIDLQLDHVEVGFNFNVPDITMGAFSLTKLVLAAGLKIPFFGDPVTIRFRVSEKDHPFVITVYIFGGGGYFELEVGLDGVRALDIELEFGANYSLNLGVASGGVHAMVGIYLHYQADTKDVTLTGFFKSGGELSVLGIISVSVEFDMSLTYDIGTGKCSGDASLTIQVKLLIFSTSVVLTVHKDFSGGNASAHLLEDELTPVVSGAAVNIGTMMTPTQWTTYCAAFG